MAKGEITIEINVPKALEALRVATAFIEAVSAGAYGCPGARMGAIKTLAKMQERGPWAVEIKEGEKCKK